MIGLDLPIVQETYREWKQKGGSDTRKCKPKEYF